MLDKIYEFTETPEYKRLNMQLNPDDFAKFNKIKHFTQIKNDSTMFRALIHAAYEEIVEKSKKVKK